MILVLPDIPLLLATTEVLPGAPTEIYPSIKNINFDKAKTVVFNVYGRDASGYEALIEPQDIKLEYDNTLIEITKRSDGAYTIKPLQNSLSALVSISAGGLQTYISAIAGTKRQIINSFDNISQWGFENFPTETVGSISMSTAKGRGNVLKLNYDFTKSNTTRIAHVKPMPSPIEIPSDAIRVGLWVNGDNANGEWMRINLLDKTGKVFDIDLAQSINWKGWKYVSAAIPAGIKPFVIDRFYVVETNPEKKNTGSILVDDLTLEFQHTIELPLEQETKDTILDSWSSLPSDSTKFAVVSGLELSNGGIFGSLRARQVLKNLNKETIDFAILNGGIVTKDSLEIYSYAKDFITNILGFPYYAVSGRQEVSGSNNLQNFANTFGNDFQQFDHKGTRFILLNSSLGNLRVSNPTQWQSLMKWMESSKSDETIKNIVLINQAPLNMSSTLSTAGSDSYESRLLEDMLTEIVEDTGKGVSYISSGTSEMNVKRYNGVPYIDTGSSADPNYSVFGINNLDNVNDFIIVKFTP